MELICNDCADSIVVEDEEAGRDEGWAQIDDGPNGKVWVCDACWEEREDEEEEEDD